MDYKIEDVELLKSFKSLNIDKPEKLCFIPENINVAEKKKDFIFTGTISNLSKTLKNNDIEYEILGGEIEKERSRKDANLFLPAIFLSLSLISENPALISVSLNVIGNYVTDFFKGRFGGNKKVNFDIYVETKGRKNIKKISYEGNVEGISKLEDIIKSL